MQMEDVTNISPKNIRGKKPVMRVCQSRSVILILLNQTRGLYHVQYRVVTANSCSIYVESFHFRTVQNYIFLQAWPERVPSQCFLYIKCNILHRYNILGAKSLDKAKNEKAAAKMLFDIVGLENEKYRLGHTKV